MTEFIDLTPADAGELLTLQRAAYVTEAQLYGDPALPALTQTLDELTTELNNPAIGVRDGARLIAAGRWRVVDGIAEIGRLVVAPDRQGEGWGTRLLREIETRSGCDVWQLFTGHLSEANLRLYRREGYVEIGRTALHEGVNLVHLRKVAR